MTLFNEQDKNVQLYLNEQNIEYNCYYRGDGRKDNWEFDRWQIIFCIGNYDFGCEYKTGIGHRLKRDILTSDPNYFHKKYSQNKVFTRKLKRELDEFKRLTQDTGRKYIFETLNENHLLSIAPTAASVLYCLLSDLDCLEYNFKDWCNNLGFNSDSIKDLNINNKCIDQSREFLDFFSKGRIEKLRELLEDY